MTLTHFSAHFSGHNEYFITEKRNEIPLNNGFFPLERQTCKLAIKIATSLATLEKDELSQNPTFDPKNGT